MTSLGLRSPGPHLILQVAHALLQLALLINPPLLAIYHLQLQVAW